MSFTGRATPRVEAFLLELASGELTVGQLAQPFSMSLAAASKHIRVLESAGLIHRKARGRVQFCLDHGPLESAHERLTLYERFWTVRLRSDPSQGGGA
jgi:DNA-binding transcriptional ArsR family regulator